MGWDKLCQRSLRIVKSASLRASCGGLGTLKSEAESLFRASVTVQPVWCLTHDRHDRIDRWRPPNTGVPPSFTASLLLSHDTHTPSMTTTVSASRNKPFKINGHNDAIFSQDRIHPTDSPKLSPQISFRCLDDAQPHSSSEDDHSDMSADDSEYQGPVRNSTAPSQRERMVNEINVDVGSDFTKGQVRSSSLADLDLSIIIAVIAPLVNWLTGSDQIKNLFLILFLIVYLHQLVQGMSR